MVLYAVGPSFLVPGAVMTIAAGLAFGTGWGSVYSLIGADVGAVVAFGAGRWLGKSFVERIVGERFHEVLRKIARNGFQIIFYLRMVPVIPYNALNLLAGASPIKFKDYFWASMIGMIPGTILFAFLGDALWHPMSPRFFLALLLIGLSVLCGEIWRRWSKIGVEEPRLKSSRHPYFPSPFWERVASTAPSEVSSDSPPNFQRAVGIHRRAIAAMTS